ncbi:cytoplasmic dynein 2 intermediate chain 1 [Schistocerca serialis cubense]|uniref:cytoplasmic dynein 2 intermediate chain 1 n=1 Tax=Schistocerca serialis cubense TaxID=2023355 RepID=UPI00214DF634|nr:cytoplasmic dynein 2 intermediate chain 1 [Schistocerca serialis cubense]XP_049952495.1 cytoplasmic dynein 2 intermediate chain 1 [Schistocerca serialis cubense]
MPPDRGSTRKPAPPDKDGTKKTTPGKSHNSRQEGTKGKRTADDKDKRKEDQKATVERTPKSRDSSSLRTNDSRSQQKTLRRGDDVPVKKREIDKSDRISLDKRDNRNTTDALKQKSSRNVSNDVNKLKETLMKRRNAGQSAEKSTTPRRPPDVSSRELRTSTHSLSRKTTNSLKPSSTSSPRYDSRSQQKLSTTTYRQVDQNKLQRNESKSRTHGKESISGIKQSLVTNTTDSNELSAAVNAEPAASHKKDYERHSRKSIEENMAHQRSQPRKLSRDRTRTRTLSPREVKVVKDVGTFDKQKMKDEIEKFLNTPSTSSAVPLMPPTMVASKEEPNIENDEEYEYEDDFEDYESDFEECTDSDEDSESSTSDSSNSEIVAQDNDPKNSSLQQKPSVEEEKKMDSGNYDLAENQRKEKRIQELKLAVEKENATVAQKRNKPPLERSEQVFEDEGFEDDKSEEMKNVSIKMKQSSINFESARKTRLQQQMLRRVKKRGEQLMKMIHFDVVSFGLLDLPPIPYDIYMRCYGKCNSVQAYVQTNEDNLTEETQTEEITMKNKWTQNPVSFHTLKKEDDKNNEIQLFSQESRGVGGDEVEENADVWKSFIKIDTVRLSHFLQSAGKAVLILLEESLLQKNEKWKNKTKLPFSDGFVSLNVDSVDCLKNIPVTLIRFPPGQATILLTAHQGKDQVSNLCVWSLLEPSKPFMVLSCPGTVSATCFDSRAHVVVAGLSDGTICLWDLKEDSAHHITGMRSPTYNTANFLRKDGHFQSVVAIEPITHKVENTGTVLSSEVSPAQICSLDAGGLIVIWTVIQNSQTEFLPARASQMDLGLAYWGRTRLILSSVVNIPVRMASFSLLKDAEYLSLGIDDKDHLYVGTTAGRIIHCLRSGMKPRPKMYLTSDDVCSLATCIDVCPFGEPFFLVGCSDGSMKLFWRNSEKGIAQTPAGTSPLVSVQWLSHSPCSIFSLDRTSRIQVWDVNVSDVSPVHSVCCEKTATSMRLSPRHINGREIPTLVLSFEDGTMEVHQLRKEFWNHSQSDFRDKINNFLRYTGVF